MKPKHFIMLAAIAMMTACTTNEDEFNLTPEQPAKQPLSEMRSFEEALQIAQNSISLLNNGEATRASSIRKINLADCKAVMRDASTRSSEGSNDTLMYVFNFEDNQGFAIVSASKSTEGLLAVTEKGYYDPEEGSNVESFNFFMEKARDYVAKAPKLRIPDIPPILESKDSFVYTASSKGPFVTVEWGQEFPEGELCPNGLAGCTNTALAQIMSYYNYPTSIAINYPGADVSTQALNWIQMKAHQTGHELDSCQSQSTHLAISRLLRQLGEMNNSQYIQCSPTQSPRTNTLSQYIIPYTLQTLLYTYNTWVEYDFSTAENHLNAYHPLMILGRSLKNGISCDHDWVFDGYMIMTIYCYHLIHDPINSSNWVVESVTTTTHKLCHYNWGWYGDCNGYFASNVFDTQNEFLNNGNGEHDFNFCNDVKIIPIYPLQ